VRKELRLSVPPDEAIDAVLRDMVAREAPPMLKARVLARLGDDAIDVTLRNIAAEDVPSTLRGRVMARLEEESTRADRAQEKRWTLARPLLRPAFGLAAAGLVAAVALTAWLFRAPWVPSPGSERPGQTARRLEGGGGISATGKGPQSAGAMTGVGSPSGPSVASVIVSRASRSVTRPAGATRLPRHTTTWRGAESENAAPDADDPLAIRQLRVVPLSVSTIAIPAIEVTPVEIVPPMSDAAPSPPGEPDAESRSGG